MAAGVFRLDIDQGATLALPITWRDENNALVNLTGYTARAQVRETEDAPTVDLEMTTGNGRIALGGAAGTITLTVAAADTAALTARPALTPAKWDLELVSAGGVVTRLLQGDCVISREITR